MIIWVVTLWFILSILLSIHAICLLEEITELQQEIVLLEQRAKLSDKGFERFRKHFEIINQQTEDLLNKNAELRSRVKFDTDEKYIQSLHELINALGAKLDFQESQIKNLLAPYREGLKDLN